MTKKLLLALTLVLFMQSGSFAVEDAWGGMGLSEDSVNYDYANTVFDKYTAPNNQEIPNYSQGNYPTDLSSQSAQTPIDKEKKNYQRY